MQTLTTSSAASVDAKLFRRLLGRFATGVVVLTASVPDGVIGMTMNAFMSGSLQPPLVVLSIARSASWHELLTTSVGLGVSILAHDQEPVSRHFARQEQLGAGPAYDYFGDVPVLAGAHAALALRTHATHSCGDHTLLVGLVTHGRVSDAGPLLYYEGGYRALTPGNAVRASHTDA
jgi:flavin reductase